MKELANLSVGIVENQLPIALVALLAGTLLTVWVAKSGFSRKWKVADLIWVLAGGAAAISAIAASLYISKSDAINRRVSIILSTTSVIVYSGESFNLKHCQNRNFVTNVYHDDEEALCSRARMMITSISSNESLPLFSDIADAMSFPVSVTSKFVFFSALGSDFSELDPAILKRYADGWEGRREAVKKAAEAIAKAEPETRIFDIPASESIGLIDPYPSSVQAAIKTLDGSGYHNDMVSEYRSLALAYDNNLSKLVFANQEWIDNSNRYYFLLLRAMAILLVAFAFPLRVGKAIHELVEVAKESEQA